jgi:hypothetical protein
MFCPKCGTQNPETGKFCRACGTDLATVSDALSGKTSNNSRGFGMIEPLQPMNLTGRRGRPINWESAFRKIFTGVAFLIVAIVLGFTGRASNWWFWMLIPAFGMLGSGFAHYIQLKNSPPQNASAAPHNAPNVISSAPQNAALPPSQTEYIAPDSRYKTGDLVPPSVTDNTTRHLEISSEGETMTLPKK